MNQKYPYPYKSRRFIKGPIWYQHVWRDMSNWCDAHMPDSWEYDGGYFVFKREQDLTMFILKWGS